MSASTLDLLDRVVAEKRGFALYLSTKEQRRWVRPLPEAFVAHLEAMGLKPLSVGRVIVPTWEPNKAAVLDTIRTLGLDPQSSSTKGSATYKRWP